KNPNLRVVAPQRPGVVFVKRLVGGAGRARALCLRQVVHLFRKSLQRCDQAGSRLQDTKRAVAANRTARRQPLIDRRTAGEESAMWTGYVERLRSYGKASSFAGFCFDMRSTSDTDSPLERSASRNAAKPSVGSALPF